MVLRNVAWDRSAWLGLAVTIGCALAIGSGRGSGRTAGVPDSRPTAAAVDAASDVGVPRSYRLAASVSLDHVPGERLLPTDVALGPEGTMYVADFTSHTVVVFNADGTERERWRHQLAQLACGGVLVPIAIDASPDGDVAVLWTRFAIENGRPQLGYRPTYVELRSPEGTVTSTLRIGAEFTDLAMFGGEVYLVQPGTILISDRSGAINADRQLLISVVRRQAGSFDMVAADRVASIKENGTVHVQTVSPYTDKMVDIGRLQPLAIDAVGTTVHVIAVDAATSTVHHVVVDASGRRVSDVPLPGVSYRASTIEAWPLSGAAQSQGMVTLGADDDGLVLTRLDAADQPVATVHAGPPDGAMPDKPTQRGWTACGDGSMRLGTATSDGVVVYDHEERRIVAYDRQLVQLGARPVASELVSVDAVGPTTDDVVMITASDHLVRTDLDPTAAATVGCLVQLRWDGSCGVEHRQLGGGSPLR
ncbi:MAG: hypothetical protein IPG72_13725 [Ardenticatenales bacterium]|nr:hypothetical protein [Ardenticatenales bacterium]